MAAHAAVVRALIEYSQQDVTASHVILVPFVSIALIFANRTAIFSSMSTKPAVGLPLIAAGLGLSAIGQFAIADAARALTVSVSGLALSWVGGYVLFYGAAAARASVFAL